MPPRHNPFGGGASKDFFQLSVKEQQEVGFYGNKNKVQPAAVTTGHGNKQVGKKGADKKTTNSPENASKPNQVQTSGQSKGGNRIKKRIEAIQSGDREGKNQSTVTTTQSNATVNLPASFKDSNEYRQFYSRLVEIEMEAEREATELHIQELEIEWNLQFRKATGETNFVMSFCLPIEERSLYRIKNGTFCQWFHDDLPELESKVKLYGYVAHLNPIKEDIHVVIDQNQKGVAQVVNNYRRLSTSNWTLKLLFDPATFVRMQRALITTSQFPPSLSKAFFGHTNGNDNDDGDDDHDNNDDDDDDDDDSKGQGLLSTQESSQTIIQNDWRSKSKLFDPKYLPQKVEHAPSLKPLNQYQEEAIKVALTRPLFSITGPPGSGKTTTLSNLVYHIHRARGLENKDRIRQHYEKVGHVKDPYDLTEMVMKVKKTPPPPPSKPGPILVCAPSNVATDHLAGILLKIPGLDVLRITSKRYQALNYATQDDEVENSALHRRIESWMLENPDSELAQLHKSNFSYLDNNLLQTLGAKLDSVFNDDHFCFEDDDDYQAYDPDDKGKLKFDLETHHGSAKFINTLMTKLGHRLTEGLRKNKLTDNQVWAKLYYDLQSSIIKNSDIVCCTFALTGNPLLFNNIEFPYVILDEVSQSTEPQLLLPLSFKPKSLVLFGDRQQLGPVVQSKDPLTKAGLERSLFSRLVLTKACPNITLNIQYRMHPAIAEYSSREFYQGRLTNGVSAHNRQALLPFFPWPNPEIPIAFLSTAKHVDSFEQWHGTSAANMGDALQTVRVVSGFIEQGTPLADIGIVVPYRAQATQLLRMLCDPSGNFCRLVMNLYCISGENTNSTPVNRRNNNSNQRNAPAATEAMTDNAIELIQQQLQIDTVDAFQGREKPLMVFNIVRTSPASFLTSNRLNVALTRAQCGMIIVGNERALNDKAGPMFFNLLQLYHRYNAFVDHDKVEHLLDGKFRDVIKATMDKKTKAEMDRLKQEREIERKQAELQLHAKPSILRRDAPPFIPKEMQSK